MVYETDGMKIIDLKIARNYFYLGWTEGLVSVLYDTNIDTA